MAGLPMPGMMGGGGAPGAPAAPSPMGAPGAAARPNPMAAMAPVLSRFLAQQNDDAMLGQIAEKAMTMVGVLMQRAMTRNPKVYQALLRAQTALHSATQELKQQTAQHQPIMNAVTMLGRQNPGEKTPPY